MLHPLQFLQKQVESTKENIIRDLIMNKFVLVPNGTPFETIWIAYDAQDVECFKIKLTHHDLRLIYANANREVAYKLAHKASKLIIDLHVIFNHYTLSIENDESNWETLINCSEIRAMYLEQLWKLLVDDPFFGLTSEMVDTLKQKLQGKLESADERKFYTQIDMLIAQKEYAAAIELAKTELCNLPLAKQEYCDYLYVVGEKLYNNPDATEQCYNALKESLSITNTIFVWGASEKLLTIAIAQSGDSENSLDEKRYWHKEVIYYSLFAAMFGKNSERTFLLSAVTALCGNDFQTTHAVMDLKNRCSDKVYHRDEFNYYECIGFLADLVVTLTDLHVQKNTAVRSAAAAVTSNAPSPAMLTSFDAMKLGDVSLDPEEEVKPAPLMSKPNIM